MAATDHLREEFSRDLHLDVTSLAFIKGNPYCSIYRLETSEGPAILKKYLGDDPALAETEARAVDFYHTLAHDSADLVDSTTRRLVKEKNLVCIGFVEGEAFSSVLYKSLRDVELRRRCVRAMRILGKLMRRVYDATVLPDEATDPFIFDYFNYCSTRLQEMPVLGRAIFKGLVASAEAIARDFRDARVAPSYIHGDLVFANIHISGDRIGLIDLANTNPRSHLLNDFYNLRLALHNMMLPKSFKKQLMAALGEGLGDLTFPGVAHRFYYEYHRRRWLMLKIRCRKPFFWLEAARGLATGYVRPFRNDVISWPNASQALTR